MEWKQRLLSIAGTVSKFLIGGTVFAATVNLAGSTPSCAGTCTGCPLAVGVVYLLWNGTLGAIAAAIALTVLDTAFKRCFKSG